MLTGQFCFFNCCLSSQRINDNRTQKAAFLYKASKKTAFILLFLIKLIKTVDEKKQKLIDVIESVKNPQYYDFLYKRYVEGKKLTVIADEMEYNEEYIKQFHGKAVNYVKELLNFKS